MATTLDPFLMFTGDAEDAMTFYVSVVPDSKIVSIDRYGAGEDGKDGTVRTASFILSGQLVRCTDSPIKHAFTFTPSMSFFLSVDDVARVDRLASALGENGKVLMPPDNYGFSQRFAWVQDRFGVSWQINCD